MYEIHIIHGKAVCYHEKVGIKKPIEYLGFSFDGQRILLKNASLCHYYNKMRIDKRRHKHWAISINNKTHGRVFTNQIVRRFTLAGAKRHHILIPLKNGRFKQSKEKSFGNYLNYAYKAADVMNEPHIKRQLRRNLHKVKMNIIEIKRDVSRVHRAQLYNLLNDGL